MINLEITSTCNCCGEDIKLIEIIDWKDLPSKLFELENTHYSDIRNIKIIDEE